MTANFRPAIKYIPNSYNTMDNFFLFSKQSYDKMKLAARYCYAMEYTFYEIICDFGRSIERMSYVELAHSTVMFRSLIKRISLKLYNLFKLV